MNKPLISYDSRGASGNIYWIIGMVQRVLRREGRDSEYTEMWERVQKTHSYKEALEVIGEYVTLVDMA